MMLVTMVVVMIIVTMMTRMVMIVMKVLRMSQSSASSPWSHKRQCRKKSVLMEDVLLIIIFTFQLLKKPWSQVSSFSSSTRYHT